jgi:multisubunit Na+/H+ antiporter MnhE subunit
MIEPLLQRQLDPAVRRFRRQKVLLTLLLCWAACALAIGALWAGSSLAGIRPHRDVVLIAVAMCIVSAGVAVARARRWRPDYRNVAHHIELHHPELHAVLLTAVEQRPDAATGQYSYLQQRVIQEAVAGAGVTKWVDTVPPNRLAALQLAHWTAFAAFVTLVAATFTMSPAQVRRLILRSGVEVSPGDTALERGSPLVVLARFDGRVPAAATLLVDAQNQPGQRIPLVKNLDDPIFGGTMPISFTR